MKMMKKIAGIALAMGIMINMAYAQPRKSATERIDARIQKMDQELDLSAKQEKQLKDVMLNHMTVRKQIQEESRAKQMDDRKQMQSEINSILTADQQKKMKEQQAAKREEMAKKRMDEMKSQLGLSDEQVSKLQALNKEHKSRMQDIKAMPEDARAEAFKAEKKNHHEAMKAILTPAQLEKLKQMREEHKGKGQGKARK